MMGKVEYVLSTVALCVAAFTPREHKANLLLLAIALALFAIYEKLDSRP